MQTTFHVEFRVDFVSESGNGMQGYAGLDVDLPFAPPQDIEFDHPVWREPRKPTSVSTIGALRLAASFCRGSHLMRDRTRSLKP